MGIVPIRCTLVRLRILAWGDTVEGIMSKKLRVFRVQPHDSSGEPILNPRAIQARTEDGAVRKLVRWLEWEGYEVEGLCVHLEEINDEEY